MILKLITFIFPWFIRRRLLNSWYGYKIDSKAKIGLSWIFPDSLIMEEGSYIGNFNVAINLNHIYMARSAKINRGNWITGYPLGTKSKHFNHQKERLPSLHIGKFSSVTKNHHFDCTNSIIIEDFSTIAGYSSQFLTHSIDVENNRQDSKPIYIGKYTFVSTNVVVLGGAILPSYSILGAKALLNKSFSKEYFLYGGVPAKPVKEINKSSKYFNRKDGFVY